MGQLTQTTTELQAIVDNSDAANVGKTSLTDGSDTTAVAFKKSGFYSLQASSSNAPSTDRAVLISAVRNTAATGEIRYGQIAITESNGLWWNRDDGGSLGTWYAAVSTTGTQTLTNKTLTSPVLTTPQINDSAADHQYIFAGSDLAADRTITLPLLTGNDTFVFAAHTQTLTNKTLTAPTVSALTLSDASIIFEGATADDHETTLTVTDPTADRTITLPDATDTLVGLATTDTLTNKTLTSPVFNTGVSGTAVLDADDFTGASATTLASSESIKAYVDTKFASGNELSEVLAAGNVTGANDIDVENAQKVQFRDSAIYINSSADGQLDIVADTEIQIAATTIDINGAIVASGDISAASLDISGDIDVDGTTNLDVVDIDGAVDFASTTAHAGDATFADNAKAIFGAGSDLQIYHTGSDSRILDNGTGNLRIMANNLRMQSALGEQYIIADDGGAVTAYYDNAARLSTTSTGIDITGTATMDGLTVTKEGTDHLKIIDTSSSNALTVGIGNTVGSVAVDPTGSVASSKLDFSIDGNTALRIAEGGDISFYEDTGTTPKLFWDASAESLGIGTSSIGAGAKLQVEGETRIYPASGSAVLRFGSGGVEKGKLSIDTSSNMAFETAGSERLRINATGIQVTGDIANASGDLTLDVAGDIILDASGADVFFGASGNVGSINMASNNVTLSSLISDKDIYFQGNDGGSTITALTLDMSEAGAATFNAGITIPDFIYHSGDTHTYFGFQGGDQFELDTGGANRMRVVGSEVAFNDDGGDKDFRVESDTNTHALFVDASTNCVNIQTAGGVQSIAGLNSRVNGAAIEFGHTNNSAGYFGTLGSQGNNGHPYLGFSTSAEFNLNTFKTYGAAGNIIVGDLSGNLMFSQVVTADAVNQTPIERMRIQQGSLVINEPSNNYDFRVESNGNANMLFIDANNNRVGIGTGAPSYEFVVSKDATSGIEFGPQGINSTTSFIQFYNRSTAAYDTARFYGNNYEWYLGATTTGMTLSTSSLIVNESGASSDFRVESDGNANALLVDASAGTVAINTATLTHAGSTGGSLVVNGGSTSATTPIMMVVDGDGSVEGGSTLLECNFAGDTGFSAANYVQFRDLDGVQGTINGTGDGTVTYSTSSDERLKQNIQDTESKWELVKSLQVRDYEWKKSGKQDTGFIAQELHGKWAQPVKVGGEDVTNDPWSVDYGQLTPVLTKALQEAMQKIETLEARIAALES